MRETEIRRFMVVSIVVVCTHLLALNEPERLLDRRGGGDLVRLRCIGERE